MNIALRRFLHNHGNIATERSRDYALLLFRMTSRAFSSAQYTIGSTVHSRLLNSLEHWICTTTMTKIRPDRDSNLVPPGYKPQSIRMRHRDRLPLPRSKVQLLQCRFIWIKVSRKCKCGDYGPGSVHQAESAGRGLVDWTSAIISTLARYEWSLCIFSHDKYKKWII